MRIALIGMSGIGKSYWSNRLQEAGFRRFDCDEIIAHKLSQEMDLALKTVLDVGQWMGLPTESHYKARADQYLALEATVLQEIGAALETDKALAKANVVIDTTGSAIYAPPAILTNFRQQVKTVYLAATPEVRSDMLQAYLKNPPPVIWNDLFQPEAGEPLDETFRRCYAALLQDRERLYEKYSDRRIEYQDHRNWTLTTSEFLHMIEKAVKSEGNVNL
jgi:shikimate kinase